jgi:hypothetical protein
VLWIGLVKPGGEGELRGGGGGEEGRWEGENMVYGEDVEKD